VWIVARRGPTTTSGPAGPEPKAGRSRTQGGTWSGWHVHPGYDTYVFQTEGHLRLEFGAGGTESVEGGPGDFVLIPKGVVHREGNPGTEPNEAIVFRVGEGEVLVNVEGPLGPHL
jgi:mannose-6-phosphate isomerase-like protein (cupin superfamily)